MRIFVSSSFEDLREHRAAAIRVLRQLGHEVVAMEDLVAGQAVPLRRVLQDVERCDVYVGFFAWRYGFVPAAAGPGSPLPDVPGASAGTTSITHYEYLYAKAQGLEVLALLLDESYPWPPHLIDGFAEMPGIAASRGSADIKALRSQLQLEHVVSYFTTPDDLEARVSAAVTVAGMSRQVQLNLVTLGQAISTVPDSLPYEGIRATLSQAGQQRVLKIDLATTWWSTRLYLTAALAERITNVRRILVVNNAEFVGLLSTGVIVSTLATMHASLSNFHAELKARNTTVLNIESEMLAVFELWETAFGGGAVWQQQERATRVDVTPDLLRRWFGDAMLQQPVRIADLARASVVDLLRLLDYPSDFVPVVSLRPDSARAPLARIAPAGGVPQPADSALQSDPVAVVDKAALNAQLAQSYVIELMDRARIA